MARINPSFDSTRDPIFWFNGSVRVELKPAGKLQPESHLPGTEIPMYGTVKCRLTQQKTWTQASDEQRRRKQQRAEENESQQADRIGAFDELSPLANLGEIDGLGLCGLSIFTYII